MEEVSLKKKIMRSFSTRFNKRGSVGLEPQKNSPPPLNLNGEGETSSEKKQKKGLMQTLRVSLAKLPRMSSGKLTSSRSSQRSSRNSQRMDFALSHDYISLLDHVSLSSCLVMKNGEDKPFQDLLAQVTDFKKRYTQADHEFLCDFSMSYGFFISPQELISTLVSRFKKARSRALQSRIVTVVSTLAKFCRSLLNSKVNPEVFEELKKMAELVESSKCQNKDEFESACTKVFFI